MVLPIQTIPFRVLETFTSAKTVALHISDASIVRSFLEEVFGYLVQRDYFRLLRQMLDAKVPPLDGPVQVAPNSISETLLQMIVHPLKLVDSCTGCSRLILGSFVEQILASAFSDPIRLFVIPCLAADPLFPFLQLNQFLISVVGQPVPPPSNANVMEVDEHSDVVRVAEDSLAARLTGSAFLLNAVLSLDVIHQPELAKPRNLALYIQVLAALSVNLNRLPARKATRRNKITNQGADDEGNGAQSSDSDDEDNASTELQNGRWATQLEKEVLLEAVEQLNDTDRTQLICESVEVYFLNEPKVLHALCQICHYLMLYNRSASKDYA